MHCEAVAPVSPACFDPNMNHSCSLFGSEVVRRRTGAEADNVGI